MENKVKPFSRSQTLKFFLVTYAIAMASMAIIGGFINYTPVPFWDMWVALGFFANVSTSGFDLWWAQHNEHRILLSKILFWIDFRFFNGKSIFLIIANYALIILAACIFALITKEIFKNRDDNEIKIATIAVITGTLFSWIQKENITWAFQSQFFLAQTLPLCGFYLLYKSTNSRHSTKYFIAACAIGGLSIATMANGVAALPLMAGLSIITKQRAIRTITLCTLSTASIYLYFSNYQTPPNHGGRFAIAFEDPVNYMKYIFMYMGSPIYRIFENFSFAKESALLGGFIFCVLTAISIAHQAINNFRSTIAVALTCFIAYIGATACGTAAGRLIFGLDQALSSRYTTPTIMAWCALCLIYLQFFTKLNTKHRFIFKIISAGFCITLLYKQSDALDHIGEEIFNREVAALAIILEIEDQYRIGKIYPTATDVTGQSKRIGSMGISIYGLYPYRGLKEKIGTMHALKKSPPCRGFIDGTSSISDHVDYKHVSGWLMPTDGKQEPKLIRFIDESGMVFGYALLGMPRPDVGKKFGAEGNLSGYNGYILKQRAGDEITLEAENSNGVICSMKSNL